MSPFPVAETADKDVDLLPTESVLLLSPVSGKISLLNLRCTQTDPGHGSVESDQDMHPHHRVASLSAFLVHGHSLQFLLYSQIIFTSLIQTKLSGETDQMVCNGISLGEVFVPRPIQMKPQVTGFPAHG